MQRALLGLVSALFALTVTVSAQNVNGSMSGRLLDAQGASIPNATVTLTEPARGISHTAKSNEQGDFVFPGLAPGSYNLTAEAPGFKKLKDRNISLSADDKLSLGSIVLEVGAVTESVEISAQAALLQTESAERGTALVGKQMENIEVNGRNALDMTKLVPGVVDLASFAVGGAGGIGSIQVNGNRGSANMLSINGLDNLDTGSNGSQNVTVSIDSTAEFKILTGMYQAEYGRNAGGQIAVVTKSGTEQFHGSGYLYHRNEEFNANTWINNAKNLPRALYRYNDPGYTIGGPAFIPKIMPARLKNRIFFFWSQEWQEQLVPNTPRNVTVATALERKGDFSQSVDNNGKPLTIKDPNTGQPFPGNMIPTNRLYGPGVALMNLFPLPNVVGQIGYNYSSQISGHAPRREDLLRLDYNVTQNLRVFGHYINNAQPLVMPYGSFVLGINVPVAPILYPNPGKSWGGGATWTITPTMTNEFNMGYTHNSIDIIEGGNALTRTTSGINFPLLYPSAVQDDYIPGFQLGGSHLANSPVFTSVGDAPFHNYNTVINFSDGVTKIWGRHTIKTGLYMERSRKDQSSFGNNNGQFNFGDTSNNPLDTGYGYSNAALGVYQTFDQASNYVIGQYRYWNIEAYVQDTWKLTQRITLDYGLRAAWYQPQYDASMQASTFVLSQWNPAKAPRLYFPAIINGVKSAYDATTGQVLPSYDIGLEVPGTGDPFNGVCQAPKCANKYLQENRGPQWGPRFGLAWDVTGKQNIVIRTGGGVYYDRFQGNRVFDMVRNPPEGIDPQFLYGFAANINPNNILLAPPTLYAADPTAKLPTTYNYQFSIQSKLPFGMMLDTAYVGNISRHLQDNRNLNYISFGADFAAKNQDPTLVATQPTALLGNNALSTNFMRPIYGFGNINLYESQSTSNYNALQVSLNRRAAHGLFFGLAYTWSKALTTASSDSTFVRADQYERVANYGPASFDRRQVLAINYLYAFPNMHDGNRIVHAFTNGWQFSGVTQVSTGAPFTPGLSISGVGNQNITGSNTEGARIGIVSGCNPYTSTDNPWNRLNSACFTAPQPGSLGLESGSNFLYQPGLVNYDMSLVKQFTVQERLRFQFRVDAFNIFNHANFTNLNTTVNYSGSYPNNLTVANNPYNSAGVLVNQNGFGTVSGVGSPRILMLVVRVTF